MAYVAVTGGKEAIEHSNNLIKYYRVKDGNDLTVKMIKAQMRGLVDRVMSEGGVFSPELAALAIKQSEGNIEESVFLLRAFRSTLPRKYYSNTVDTEEMKILRRISAAFKDIPGGQLLGPTYDYSHRLLDFDLIEEENCKTWIENLKKEVEKNYIHEEIKYPKISNLLRKEGLIKEYSQDEKEPFDATRDKIIFPLPRSGRLQILSRGESGAVTAIGYSSLRGFGGNIHPTVGELRVGSVQIDIPYPLDEDESYYIGEMVLTEVENIFPESEGEEIEFKLGYGLVMGQNETKAIAMSVLDRNLDVEGDSPAQNEEFVLYHIDSVESSGFVSHLKLPHYVTFQSKLDRIRSSKKGER
ncbi:MAG: carbon-phosphorus lyase complex subunit PhnI [Cetobacterium sp.]|uniref:carbon-phosphorus lyase complex subunit PhnI n=1 Tax=Cetobacterium sp. TaxID=2071632 RepID=UPI003EE694E3